MRSCIKKMEYHLDGVQRDLSRLIWCMARPRVVEWGASSRPITSESEADDDPFVIGSRLYSRRTDDNAAQRVWFDCTPHPYGDATRGGSGASSSRSASQLRRVSGRDQG